MFNGSRNEFGMTVGVFSRSRNKFGMTVAASHHELDSGSV